MTRRHGLQYFDRVFVGTSNFNFLYRIGATGNWRAGEYLHGVTGIDAVLELRPGCDFAYHSQLNRRGNDIR